MSDITPQQFTSLEAYTKALRQRWLAERLNKKGITKMKKYYWTCPLCGANLDPNEKCDCKSKEANKTDAIRFPNGDMNINVVIRKDASK